MHFLHVLHNQAMGHILIIGRREGSLNHGGAYGESLDRSQLEGFRFLKIGPFINLGIPNPGLDWDYKREKARCWLQNALFIFSYLETTSILTGKNGITNVIFTRQLDFH